MMSLWSKEANHTKGLHHPFSSIYSLQSTRILSAEVLRNFSRSAAVQNEDEINELYFSEIVEDPKPFDLFSRRVKQEPKKASGHAG